LQLLDCYGQDVESKQACEDQALWPLEAHYKRTKDRYRAGNDSWLCDPSASDIRLRLQDVLTRLSWLTKDFRLLDSLWKQLGSLASA
jgi:hypothetical protein